MHFELDHPQESSSVSDSTRDMSPTLSEGEHELVTEVWEYEESASASEFDQCGEAAHSQLQYVVSVFLSFFLIGQ